MTEETLEFAVERFALQITAEERVLKLLASPLVVKRNRIGCHLSAGFPDTPNIDDRPVYIKNNSTDK